MLRALFTSALCLTALPALACLLGTYLTAGLELGKLSRADISKKSRCYARSRHRSSPVMWHAVGAARTFCPEAALMNGTSVGQPGGDSTRGATATAVSLLQRANFSVLSRA